MSFSALERRIDEIKFGGTTQIISLVVCGSLFAYHGAFRALYLSMESVVSNRFIFWSILNAFFFCGTALSWIVSHFGRRPSILVSLVLVGLCSNAASLSPNEWGMKLELFLSFFGLGLGIPPAVALVTEISSFRLRGLAMSFLLLFSLLGELCVLVFSNNHDLLTFQVGIQFLGVPVLIAALFAAIYLPESPFLLTEDCFTLNATLASLGPLSRRFTPSPMEYNFTSSKSSVNNTICALASVVAGTELLLMHLPMQFQPQISFKSFFISALSLIVIPGGLLGIFEAKSLLIFSLVVMCGISCAGIASPSDLGVSLVFSLLKAGTGLILVFAMSTGWCICEHPADRLKILASAWGLGKLVSFAVPLPLTASGEETTFAALFGLLAVLVMALAASDITKQQKGENDDFSESLYHRGKFEKIPVLPINVSPPYTSPYGSI